MNPRLRTALVMLAASVLAVWIGISLAQEKHLIASVAAMVSFWAVLAWTRGPLAESWLVAFLVFGYVIGSRGFAQIMPVSGVPLFLSELGLAASVLLVLLRGAQSRVLPLHHDWLNGLLLLWVALGAGRIAWDVRSYGFLALRDFATVYYAGYFFVAQALARHDHSRRMLHRAILVTFAVLPFPAIVSALFADFFLNNLLINGVPLIYYKGDLLATFLFTGFIILLPTGRLNWFGTAPWRWLIALTSLAFGLSLLSRASMVGLLIATAWMAWAGRWRPFQVLAAVCLAGLLAVTTVSLLQKRDFTQTKAYAIYEAAASVIDFSGTHDYRSGFTDDKADNNRFRLVWWRNVAEETFASSPVFGLGFGADLARGFLQEYYPDSNEDFSARSPHNIFLTIFGRMGLVGAAVLALIYLTLFRGTLHLVRATRMDQSRERALALQAACWVVLVSACFGVVLEGPMGAIPLWIMLGISHEQATREVGSDQQGAATSEPVPRTAARPERAQPNE